jgi:drug/metabolite transporter (DMT)-like permease
VDATTTAAGAPPLRSGRVLAAFGALYFIWGSTYLAIRFALDGFPPLILAGARFTLAGATLYLALRARGAPNPALREWRAALLVGTLLTGGNALVVVAEQWVSSGVAAVAIASVPLWTVLFAGLWGRWPAKGEWIGLGIGLAGVALLEARGELRASPAGTIVLTLATASWALGSMWGGRLALPKGLMASACEMLGGGAVLLVAALLHRERIVALPPWRATAAFLYLVSFGSIVAYSAYAFLLRTVRPALATSYAYVNPVVAVALGAALGGETIAANAVWALVLILSGVGMIALQRGRA